MAVIALVLICAILCFAVVLLVGAPYVPTLAPQVEAALKLANLKSGQHLIELGCGDGRVVLAAAKQGLKVTGYELNPVLALVAWARTRRYRKQVKIIWGDFWGREWPEADAVFVFLLDRFMTKLDARLKECPYKPIKLLSFAFKVPGKTVSKREAGIYLYRYR